jgi:hypothetical protein
LWCCPHSAHLIRCTRNESRRKDIGVLYANSHRMHDSVRSFVVTSFVYA